MVPDASQYDPRPEYLRQLIGSTGMTQPQIAAVLGVSDRALRQWLSGDRKFSYPVQFTLECLVLAP